MDFTGKTASFLGDSITEGVGVEDIENCRYDNRLKKLLGLKKTYNYGISATRIAHQIHPSEHPRADLCFCGRAYDLAKDSDLIIIYGGVNDYIHGDAHFGEMTDTTPETFCGGVDFLMQFLPNAYPNARVLFLTPAHMCYAGESDAFPSPREMKQPDAKPLRAYCDVFVEKGEKYGVPVLDLYNNLGIDANDEAQRTEFTADGLHFNDKGQGVLAEKIAEFLKAL